MPNIQRPSTKRERDEVDDQLRPMNNPTGMQSGASKRVFVTDGEYAPVRNKPKNSAKTGD